MKALGADIKDFYMNHWPAGFYHDDNEIVFVDEPGTWQLEDDKKYDLSQCGNLYPEGSSPGDPTTFQSAFSQWMKRRLTKTIIIQVPSAQVEQVTAALAALGIKA